MNLLASDRGRRWLFAALYASEGAPMGFIWWALPTLLTRAGVELADITLLTSTATLPWVLKFVAGPLVDASTARGVSLRRWVLWCQSAMVLTLLPLAMIDWAGDFGLLVAFLVTHAVFAATQDVAIDTLAIRSAPAEELGRINGWMQAGLLTGRAGIAAASLQLMSVGGPPAVIALLAVTVAIPMALIIIGVREPPSGASAGVGRPGWLALVGSRRALVGLGVALTAGTGFEFFSTAVGPLLVELRASDDTVSLFFAVLAPAGLISGSVISGRWTDRIGAGPATGLGVLAVGILVALVAIILGTRGIDPASADLGAFFIIYVAIGFLTAASYALFMQLSQGGYSATRYSLFMAMTNGCEAWAGFAGGRMKEPLGYPLTLLALVAASLVSLPLLWLLLRLDRGLAANGRPARSS